MPKTFAIINQKGGVGKTTTAEAIGTGLALLHQKKVLFVDIDPQGNLSFSLQGDMQNGKPSVFEVMQMPTLAAAAIQTTSKGFDVMISSPALANAENTFTATGREYKLKEALEPVKDNYDYIIIDTPPTLGVLTINALTAADECIITAQADMYSLQGVSMLYATIGTVRKYANPALNINGILLTRYNPRTLLSKEVSRVLNETAQAIGSKLFNARIRECNAIKEAQIEQANIFAYAPKSNAAADYSSLIDEILKTGE